MRSSSVGAHPMTSSTTSSTPGFFTLLKRNIAAHDQPGVRYDVYKIDYGYYVDLLSTARSPEGLLNLDVGGFAEVPPDDYRAIRRAILDLAEFEKEAAKKASGGDGE